MERSGPIDIDRGMGRNDSARRTNKRKPSPRSSKIVEFPFIDNIHVRNRREWSWRSRKKKKTSHSDMSVIYLTHTGADANVSEGDYHHQLCDVDLT